MIGVKIKEFRIDRTRRGHHVIVRWRQKFEPAALVAMQAILGSDRNREALNLMRALSGATGKAERVSWNILYSRKL